MPLEDLHQPRKIEQRPAEPGDLVHQHAVDSASLDVSEQLAQGRSFQVGTGKSSIVITLGKCRPSRVKLALNISLGRFPLCFESIELSSASPSSVDFLV